MCFIAIGCSIAKAENADLGEKESKVRISVTGELNDADAWRVDAGCHWFPIPYVGIGGSIGMWGQYSANGIPNGNKWAVDSESSKPGNYMPNLLLCYSRPT